jgi:hypothetical protein
MCIRDSSWGDQSLALTLPATGTYTVVLKPVGSNTGSASLILSTDVEAGTVTPGGSGVPITIARSGQNARLTFSGTAGQTPKIASSGWSGMDGAAITLYNASGAPIKYCDVSTATLNCPLGTLTSTGSFTVLLTPHSAMTGSVTLGLQ